MNTTNRVLNRVLLFLAGAVLLAAGVVALAAGVLSAGDPPVWLRGPASVVTDAWGSVTTRTVEVAGVGTVPVAMVLTATVLVVMTLLLLVFVCTRRRGRSKTVLAVDAADGRTSVDRSVVDAVLTDPLVERADVLSARTEAYRIGSTRAVGLTVTVRPGASLGAVVAAAERAIAEWDGLVGTRIPIMVHLSDRRWRDALRSTTRVR